MKRIVSYLLAVILVFSLCVDAFAEPLEPEIAGSNPAAGEGEWQEGTETGENGWIPQEENGDKSTDEEHGEETGAPNGEGAEEDGSGENTNGSYSAADPNRISSDTWDKNSQEDDSEEEEEQEERNY